MELKKTSSESKGHEWSVGTTPAPFCVMQYFNDQQYLEGDREETESQKTKAGKPYEQFEASKAVQRRASKKHDLL